MHEYLSFMHIILMVGSKQVGLYNNYTDKGIQVG